MSVFIIFSMPTMESCHGESALPVSPFSEAIGYTRAFGECHNFHILLNSVALSVLEMKVPMVSVNFASLR